MADGNPVRNSDLKVRVVSAVVMVAVAGLALYLGGYAWLLFVLVIAMGVLAEWIGLVKGFAPSLASRIIWTVAGMVYVGVAAGLLAALRTAPLGLEYILAVVGGVVATDVGAYFAGRAIGGPKIAPAVSPSKTWAGLGGGIVGASLVGLIGSKLLGAGEGSGLLAGLADIVLFGVLVAVIAQTGDFFESWMKRRAGVKDSGKLIPGHGGLFDRLDGLLAVLFALALYSLYALSGQA